MNKEQFTKLVNDTRKENKNKWYFINATVENKEVQVKGYDTWLQVFNINGIDNSNTMAQNVTQFKKHILDNL